MSPTLQTLQEYLARYGWEYQTDDEAGALVTGFLDSQGRNFAIVISVSDSFVLFSLPYAALPIDPEPQNRVLTQLLELNFAWPIVKLGLDHEREIAVVTEFPVEGLTYDHFAMGVDLLTEAVEQLQERVPNLVVRVESGEEDVGQ